MFGSIRVGCDHAAITVWLKRCDSIEEKGRAVEFESSAPGERSVANNGRASAHAKLAHSLTC
jgi:hypothetical protein